MKILHRIAAMTAAATLFASPATYAQVSEDGMGKIIPVELWVCTFNEGKGLEDLEAVNAQWNAFMDDQRLKDYGAWLLMPYYQGTNQDFDVIWMGAAKDGNAMGEGAHAWITEGGEVAAAFEEVMDCPVHVGLSSAMYKEPPRNDTPQDSIMTMSDCKMNEGTRYSDVRKAELEWAAYREDQGSEAGTWHWFPVYGGGDQDYDYKIMTAYPNFKEVGADWEQVANGGGRAKSQAIFGDLDECDDERVYVARNIRSVNLRK